MYCFQLRQVSHGLTVNEYINRTRYPYIYQTHDGEWTSAFDEGFSANFMNFFGSPPVKSLTFDVPPKPAAARTAEDIWDIEKTS
jgi:hypothetical protein